MSRDFFCAHPAPDLISGSSRLPWSHFRFHDVISGSSRGCHGNVASFPVLASIPCSAELSVPVTKNRPRGRAGHVTQIRLSDWLKFEILPSDWSGLQPTPYTTNPFISFRETTFVRAYWNAILVRRHGMAPRVNESCKEMRRLIFEVDLKINS